MADEQRHRILKATAELVGEHGYLGLRIEQLRSRAKVSLPTVRKRFGDKQEALAAMLRPGRGRGGEVSEPPKALERGLAAAVLWLPSQRLLAAFLLGPYLGYAEAERIADEMEAPGSRL